MTDIEAIQTITEKNVRTKMSLTITGDNVTRRVEGLQSLAQKFVHIFLTPIGSIVLDPTRGTDIPLLLNTGALTQQEYVSHYLLMALKDTKDQINEEATEDEIIEEASLLAFSVSAGILNVTIKLTTSAGDVQYVFPTR